MKKQDQKILIIGISLFVIFMFIFAIPDIWKPKYELKKYVINHSNEAKFNDSLFFNLPYDGFYYDYITVRKYKGSEGYTLVAWGNRDNRFLWNLWLDRNFSVDINYNESQDKDTKLDKEVLKIFRK